MFKKVLPFIILLCLGNTQAREWTNTKGVVIKAEFVRLEGDSVILNIKNKEHKVALSTLSEADQKYAREAADTPKEEASAEETATTTFPLKLDRWVSGEKVDPKEAAGKPIILHAWQAHCGACPPKLKEFEKLARRKKNSGALFMIWHSVDKIPLAQTTSEKLDLKIPIYHGKGQKWDEQKFGKFTWPHVIIMKPDGEITYMGAPDRNFDKALKEITTAE